MKRIETMAVKFLLLLGLSMAAPVYAVNVNQPGGGYVNRLYTTVLGRAPDESGFNFWVGQYQSGAYSLEGIRAYFVSTTEAANYNASRQIAQYYWDLLDGPPDDAGLAYWTGQYTSGAQTLAQIRDSLANYSGNAIDAAYQSILRRPADPGGMSYYMSLLHAGQKIMDVKYMLFYSGEHYSNFPGDFAAVCDELLPFSGQSSDASLTLQTCIDQTPTGGMLSLPRGKYMLANPVMVNRGITIVTQFNPSGYRKCVAQDDADCAELIASPSFQSPGGILQVSGPFDAALNAKFDHLVVNGNKAGRQGTYAASQCAAGSATNVYGYNALMGAHNITITNSVFKNALCGTGIDMGWGNSFVFQNNTVAYNGRHDQANMWSDGLTVGTPAYSTISNNEFIDNTDVDLIFGGCPYCVIQSNTITHSDSFASSSFAALMLHQWPGSTSGNYTGTDTSGNFIDCGGGTPGGHRCGFGLYLGSSAWYPATYYGGYVHDNVINGAQQGVSIDAFSQLTIANNYVSESGGSFATYCGLQSLSAYNITPGTPVPTLAPSETISLASYTSFAHANPDPSAPLGCVPNWWQNPY